MSDDDTSRTDALRKATETHDGETRRRTVLGGVAAAAGVALGFSGATAAEEPADPDDVSPRIPDCDLGCGPELFCCEESGSNCIDYCLLCTC